MCDSVNDVPQIVKDNVKELVLCLMDKYNVPESNVIRHFDVTGKLCPASLIQQSKWDKFKEYLFKKKDNATTKVKVDLFGKVMTVDAINVNNYNYVKIRDLSCDKIKIGWNGKDVIVNGKVFKANGILHENYNYIPIRTLEQIGIKVNWDSKTNTIILR